MPMLAASWAYVSPNEFNAMANPPDAEPVMPPITLAATAIDTSGPPGTARNPSPTTAHARHPAADHGERRHRRDDSAEAHQAGRIEHRQHRGVGAGVEGLAQLR